MERTLNSVAAQTARHEIEIIFVDNNSTDGSPEAIKEWITRNPEISTRLLFENKKGATAARNKGLEAVKTPWVMFFDSDDEMLPNHICLILKAMSENPDADIIGWEINQQLPSGKRIKAQFTTLSPMQAHLVHAILATQRFAAKTELVRSAGGWDETVEGWNDYELGVRLLLKNPKMVKIHTDEPQVVTYFTENSITGRTFSDNPEKWEHSLDTIEKHLRPAAPEYLPWIAYRRAVLAADYKREGDSPNASRLLSKAKESNPLLSTLVYLHHRFIHRGAYLIARIGIKRTK